MKFAALALVALALVISFAIDFSHAVQYGAVDYRNRIVGIRVLEHGIDPYHYNWRAGDPPEFCDSRVNPVLPVSKTTVSPAMLVFYAPLAALPYRAAQFTWLFAQWALLLGTAWLWLRGGATPLKFWLTLLFLAGFTFLPGWRFELERGQCYLLLVFLFAYWLTATRGGARGSEFFAGFVAGWLIALRPPFALLLPFLVLHRRGQLAGATVGLALAVIAPMLLHPSIWADYASAMQTNSDFYRHTSWPKRPPGLQFPETVEGMPYTTLSRMVLYYPFTDSTIYFDAKVWGVTGLPSAPFLLGFGLLFLGWLALSRRAPLETLLLGLAGWVFLSDFVLPAARWGYYDVGIINVVLAAIAFARGVPWPALPAFAALPVSWSFYAMKTVPYHVICIPITLFVVCAILSLFWSAPGVERKPKADAG